MVRAEAAQAASVGGGSALATGMKRRASPWPRIARITIGAYERASGAKLYSVLVEASVKLMAAQYG